MGLVVATGIQDQLTEQLAVLGEHTDPEAVNEHQDPCADEPAHEPDVRTARFQVQIVENPNNITLFFDGHDLPPIIVSAKTGQTGKKAHGKLKKILDAVEKAGETKTATKTAAKAVTEAVKTVSKEAVKAVSERAAGKSNGN